MIGNLHVQTVYNYVHVHVHTCMNDELIPVVRVPD